MKEFDNRMSFSHVRALHIDSTLCKLKKNIFWTYLIYTIYTISTQYSHIIYTICTQCGHVCREAAVPGIYILHSTATNIYTISTQSSHIIYILSTQYLHYLHNIYTIYTLSTQCVMVRPVPGIYILHSTAQPLPAPTPAAVAGRLSHNA